MWGFRKATSERNPPADQQSRSSRQTSVFRSPFEAQGSTLSGWCFRSDAWPGSGLSTRSELPLPHHDVRDGPRYVSKRNSSENDCRAHIAVVLMSHVPVDAPAAVRQRIPWRPYLSGTCLWYLFIRLRILPLRRAACSATSRAAPQPAFGPLRRLLA